MRNLSSKHPTNIIISYRRPISIIVSIYIYIIYTPNLGLGIAVFDREREQGRFRGSREGVRAL